MLKKKRIFIKYLQESDSAPEIETAFSDYGKVINVDIKERKNFDSTCHQSKYFAYINMEIDDYKLQQCFEDFLTGLWKGQHIELQLAKENFLDQLKREREESNQINSNEDKKAENKLKRKFDETASFNTTKDKTAIITKASSEAKLHKFAETLNISNKKKFSETSQENWNTEIKTSREKGFKNEDRQEKDMKLTSSEIKRSQSVNEMIKGYREQKLIIKTALSNVDTKPNNKIRFNNSDSLIPSTDKFEASQKKNADKNPLFNSDEESDSEPNNFNFEVKETFRGKEGKKLFDLQSRYKNDKRFILDERFVNDEKQDDDAENSKAIEINTEEEKQKQFEILQQILGSQVKVKPKQHSFQQEGQTKKGMLRFDPTQSDHSKYELKNSTMVTKKCEISQHELVNKENRTDEIQQPVVSKTVFYKVSEELKETFLKSQSFSLLNTFGKYENVANNHNEEEKLKETRETNILPGDVNPFQYDSSDDDEINENLEEKDTKISKDNDENKPKNPTKLWSEPFFFRDDDFRLQEGLDFMKRMASEKNSEFVQLRRDLKNVVKAKVRNNQRKNKPFKKKLGGNKKKNMIRIKKAMKR